jgi:lipoprotein-anchoring transpeptidase ErfK/SrfK
VLSARLILTNSAYEQEGVRVVTSVGGITKRCPPRPPTPTPVPTPKPAGEKWLEINLSSQYLIVWQGNTRIAETYVSTGKAGFETPTGTYYILTKYQVQDMAGCEGGECWYVPAVPWVMYFTNFGHALHGAYWHNDFGRPRSHGCVNLPVSFAEWLYWWTPYGTRVVIHY